ncbi:DUF3137 domain-containing protein [Sulfurimonas sp.]
MKTLSELTDFYYKNLYPVLKTLEEERIALKKKLIKIGIIYISIAAFIALFLFQNAHSNFNIFVFYLFGAFTGAAILYKYLIKDYKNTFKEKIIAPLIKELDKNLDYLPRLHISEHNFIHSKLFTSRPDRVSGNDLIRGTIEGVRIELSDFHAQKRHKDSKGNNSWSTIFQGLFIISEFNKHFKGQTVILPDNAQSTFGDLVGNWLQANNFRRDELVKMDNVDFEKEFVVYSTNQIQARYILTHTLMQKLLNYKRKTKHPLSVSFIGGHIYIAIEYNKDLFEASVFHSLLKYKIAMQYLETLHLAVGIVEELQLNQKLWSKV